MMFFGDSKFNAFCSRLNSLGSKWETKLSSLLTGLCAREWALYLGWGWEIALGE
jgi:hypothetical protein